MFKAHPFFGVGIDNYGKFFKEYREVGYPLNYGFGITSTNAHNIFIQNFATGGIFVGTLYIAIQLLVLYRAIILAKNSFGDNKTKFSIIFAAWVAFQTQSLVSIDNIGLSIWGWVFGGVLVGLSFNSNTKFTSEDKLSKSSIEIKWRIVLPSLSLFLASIILIFPLLIGERNTYLSLPVAAASQKSDPKAEELFNLYSTRAINAKFISNDYLNIIANSFIETGNNEKALKLLLSINRKDPRNLDTLSLLCALFENTGNYVESIKYRKEIAKFDPWNAQNFLGLAQLYKLTNDQENMIVSANKILSFASSDPIAEVAKKEFLTSVN
jgi:tetratricopeptide (TPR) repeat protein